MEVKPKRGMKQKIKEILNSVRIIDHYISQENKRIQFHGTSSRLQYAEIMNNIKELIDEGDVTIRGEDIDDIQRWEFDSNIGIWREKKMVWV